MVNLHIYHHQNAECQLFLFLIFILIPGGVLHDISIMHQRLQQLSFGVSQHFLLTYVSNPWLPAMISSNSKLH